MSLAWPVGLIDLAVAGFPAWLVKELDFFRTGFNGAQVLAGVAAVLLLATAVSLVWPQGDWLLRGASWLNAGALLAVPGVSLWMALTAGTASHPMRFYWPHAMALMALFAVNLGATAFMASRASS